MRSSALTGLLLASLSCIGPANPVSAPKSFKGVYGALAEARSVVAGEDPLAASIRVQESPGTNLALVRFTADGEPVAIHFDPERLAALPYAAVVGIFAHEFGHVLTKDLSQARADRWAGCSLAVLGLPIDPFVKVIKNEVMDTRDSDLRAFVIESGSSECPGLVGIKP